MSPEDTARAGQVKPDFRPLHYLRIARGRQTRHTRPEDVIGYLGAWDRSNWPFRYATSVEWSTEEVTLEVVAKPKFQHCLRPK